ncbi:MAG: Alpha-glucoside transport system permease protein AglG [uncultured Nocardioidaceae bacterium]|uniref:Alpha-glucoside transport system permease protein AglG n=1 Tax=uncultured Nocardioidaceae bacterium TaxID=253824 RepID=A0A6J4MPR5_9ACTN|nr:MAG: Alpha-glucoside transport system permease protein AglG [uncultured Nocardioidaceae bacterium]
MSSSTQTLAGVGTATPRTMRKGAPRGGNPAKAGWLTRLVLLVICFLWIVPTLGLFLTSFRPVEDANSTGWWNLFTNPSSWGNLTFGNYAKAIDQASLGTAFINSVAISLPATFIPLLVSAFAAYAFTFMEFPYRDTLFLIVVALLVVPNYVSFVPVLQLYSDLGISGFAGVWLAHIGFGMSLAIYILRNYMATLPRTVIESAKIDGASHFQTFFRLILPMSMPALAAFAIFQFLWVWNDLLVALVFIGPGQDAPITVAVKNNLLGQAGAGWHLVTAGGFFSMIVPILVFLGMQRFFVRGLTAGAVKG